MVIAADAAAIRARSSGSCDLPTFGEALAGSHLYVQLETPVDHPQRHVPKGEVSKRLGNYSAWVCIWRRVISRRAFQRTSVSISACLSIHWR